MILTKGIEIRALEGEFLRLGGEIDRTTPGHIQFHFPGLPTVGVHCNRGRAGSVVSTTSGAWLERPASRTSMMKIHKTPTIQVPEVITVDCCQCGCGLPASLAPRTSRHKGWVKDQPLRFIHGHHTRSLTEAQVVEIRALYAAGSTTYEALGQQFGVTKQAIGLLIRGRTWKRTDHLACLAIPSPGQVGQVVRPTGGVLRAVRPLLCPQG